MDMKKSELKALISEVVSELDANNSAPQAKGFGPQDMVALKHKTEGYWEVISKPVWNRGGTTTFNPKIFDAFNIAGPYTK